MRKIYCFDHADLAAVRACFASPDAAIGNGTADGSGNLRFFQHDWETINPAAHAALVASGKVRIYDTMAELRSAETWTEWPL